MRNVSSWGKRVLLEFVLVSSGHLSRMNYIRGGSAVIAVPSTCLLLNIFSSVLSEEGEEGAKKLCSTQEQIQ